MMLTLVRVCTPACFSASVSDLYDSVRSTYLPTMAMLTACCGCSMASMMPFHTDRSAFGSSSCSCSQMMSSIPCACSMPGTL
ncbi:hypothetical protein D3C72_1569390 [compost metagenome]